MNTDAALILIIDDELANRDALEHLLLHEGYRTLTVPGGKWALAAVAEQLPDLILLDVTMPGMDGYEVASILKSAPATASIPIIMVTAHAGRGSRVVGLESGVEDYLVRPFDSAELLLKVRNLLRLKANVEHAAQI